jgi:hypothetical protein
MIPAAHKLLTVFAAALLASLGAACAERGASSAEDAAQRYLAAATRGDVPGIVALTPTEFDSKDAARAKADAYEPVRGATFDIAYKPHDQLPAIVTVELVARGTAFRDTVNVQKIGRRWYLTIGRYTDPPLPGPTARATP